MSNRLTGARSRQPSYSEAVATLSQVGSGRLCQLDGRSLVGRSSVCALPLQASDVSNEHAVISWGRRGWEVRDLGSRNGTFVDGRRAPAREPVRLRPGAELRFGGKERWRVEDCEPPALTAETVDEGESMSVSGRQLLAFVEGDELVGSVSRDTEGRWILEVGEGLRRLENGSRFELAGRQWRLAVPEIAQSTDLSTTNARLRLEHAHLQFVVRAGASVKMSAKVRGRSVEFQSRGHHQLLYTLARLRVNDVERGVDEFEAGWIGHPELQDLLDCTRNFVNVNVHRARKQLEEAGFVDAACLIERRHRTGKLRLGVRRVDVDGGQA